MVKPRDDQTAGSSEAVVSEDLASTVIMKRGDKRAHRLMEEGSVVMTILVHVDDIFGVEEKARCDQFDRDLDQNGPGQEPGKVTLVVGVILREGLEEGGVEDFPVGIR